MNNSSASCCYGVSRLLTGSVLTALALYASGFLVIDDMPAEPFGRTSTESDTKQAPLYWVAPMDPNFRRDEPGLSPMGMDLVPVYQEDRQDSPGTIQVTSAITQSLGVAVGPVKRLPLITELRLAGQIVTDPTYEWVLMSRVDGWVEQQFVFRVGEAVEKGDPLLSLYSPFLVSAQEELLASMASGQRLLRQASRSRLAALGMSRRWISQLERRGTVQRNVTIYAPQNGLLMALDLQPGRRVTPAVPLLTLADTTRLWVEVDAYGKAGRGFQVGDWADVKAVSGQSVSLPVTATYPLLDSSGHQRIQLDVNNAGGEWLPGEWVDVRLYKQHAPVLQIPASAVINDGIQSRVVLAVDGWQPTSSMQRFKSVAVQIGRRGAVDTVTGRAWVEVLAGLEAGDQVVTNGQFMLDSESSITSDLLRYYPQESDQERVWFSGELASPRVNDEGRIVVRHQGIPEWGWPGMVQDFHLALPMSEILARPGETMRFELVVLDDGDYCVTKVQPVVSTSTRTNMGSDSVDASATSPSVVPSSQGGMSHDHANH